MKLPHMASRNHARNLTRPGRRASACIGVLACVAAIVGSAHAATPPDFDLVGGCATAGGGTSSGGEFSVSATIGETAAGSTSGGTFDCSSGVLNTTADGTQCEPSDLDCSGSTDGGDLGIVLLNWGPCDGNVPGCVGDIDLNGFIDAGDIAMIMLGWGP